MDDHGESGSDVEDEKSRSGSSASSGSPERPRFFQLGRTSTLQRPPDFAAGPPKTTTEMSGSLPFLVALRR